MLETSAQPDINNNSALTNNNIALPVRDFIRKGTRKKTRRTIQNGDSRNILEEKFEFFPNNVLGKGEFDEVYACNDIQDSKILYAIKFENNLISNKLKLEKEIYEIMLNTEGFPFIYASGTTKTKNYIIIDRLGPSLAELFGYCKNHFSLQTILLIGIQLITRLQDLHYKTGFIYNNMKPENILIGLRQTNLLYLVDFKNCKPFRIINYQTLKVEHIPYKENIKNVGTDSFSSINQQMGIEISRRDDLESLGYMMIHFANKGLPWDDIDKESEEDISNKILEKKMAIPVEVYCKDLPVEFSMYMNYVMQLRFNEKPDYNYLKGILTDLLFTYYIEKFYFDWCLEKPKEIPTNLRINKELDIKYALKESNNVGEIIVKEKKESEETKVSKKKDSLISESESIADDEISEESGESSDGETSELELENSKSEDSSKEKPKLISTINPTDTKGGKKNKKGELRDEKILISPQKKEGNSESSSSSSNETEKNSMFNDEDVLQIFSQVNFPKLQKKSKKLLSEKSVQNADDHGRSNRSSNSFVSLIPSDHSIVTSRKKITPMGQIRMVDSKIKEEAEEDQPLSKR